jgi:DNA topoisomerase VI subunit B
LDLRTRQIQRQGLYQAAASNPALIGYAADIDALKTVIRELAEDGLKFVNEQ